MTVAVVRKDGNSERSVTVIDNCVSCAASVKNKDDVRSGC